MAGTSLAARCPACQTVFRVVPDQLRVSEGWVRCGRCAEVFNAAVNLVDTETGAPRRLSEDEVRPGAAPPAPSAPSAPAAAEPAPATPVREAADAPPPGLAPLADAHAGLPEWAQSAAGIEPIDAQADDAAPSPTAESAAAADPGDAGDPRAEPDDKPSFVRQAERAGAWRRPRVRAALAAAALLGVAGLAVQVAYEYRDLAAARSPAARPLLEAMCAALGCRIEPAHAIDGLSVESSGLVRVEKSNLYKLQVALRNRAGFEVALPALDLTLSDSQGRVIARRVLRTSEIGAQQGTLGAGRELALQATLQATAEAGAAPVAGYTIELFYP